ncbi:glycosyltransferase family 2 protein [Aurantimonas endophytica]|uniref:Alpha-1,3-rhamnosyltransferase n=1 Tax=Aurantimonas endophytica TaxID=1522175 RepID=A0A7W6HGI3_9HYPH|nr:glycosyltransferase family A protein [Aurantimonas endophytica]MBB4004825.1 alpha-1,3-rhamnosyltransferase [Aurantimonas endophytica]MCO6405635.1 glycosyltransferase [Aurantimonas endophytica]
MTDADFPSGALAQTLAMPADAGSSPVDAALPLVTIAIPSYNHERYIGECIASIIAQDYANIELIIIDDGSSDGSRAAIEALVPQCHARFARFEFRTRENRGLAATLNEAVDWARGRYFSLIASDDLMLASKTSVLVGRIEQADADVAGVFAGGNLIDEEGRRVGLLAPPERSYRFEDIILRHHFLVAPSQLLVLEKLRQVGPVPSDLYIEDWYLWLALTRNGDRLQAIGDPLIGYRQHAANMSKKVGKMLASRAQILGYHADSPFYDVAMAKCYLAAAMDHSATSKRLSLQSLSAAFGHSRRILWSRSLPRLIGKLLVPNAGLRILKQRRDRARRGARRA